MAGAANVERATRERTELAEFLATITPAEWDTPSLCEGWRVRDVDFAAGDGPEVRGPGEPLLMAMSGRRGAVGELTGPGQSLLAARIDG